MHINHIAAGILARCLALGTARAQDAPKKPHLPLEKTIGVVTPTGPVPLLAVINAAGSRIVSGKLILAPCY